MNLALALQFKMLNRTSHGDRQHDSTPFNQIEIALIYRYCCFPFLSPQHCCERNLSVMPHCLFALAHLSGRKHLTKQKIRLRSSSVVSSFNAPRLRHCQKNCVLKLKHLIICLIPFFKMLLVAPLTIKAFIIMRRDLLLWITGACWIHPKMPSTAFGEYMDLGSHTIPIFEDNASQFFYHGGLNLYFHQQKHQAELADHEDRPR